MVRLVVPPGARPAGTALALIQGVPASLSNVDLGRLGETLACQELERRGYAILATRYRTRFGEIDIIAEDDGVVVFVDVKARRSTRYVSAAESIPYPKRRRIGAMALDYLAWTNRVSQACRFDVVAIDGIGTADRVVRVIENAFTIDR